MKPRKPNCLHNLQKMDVFINKLIILEQNIYVNEALEQNISVNEAFEHWITVHINTEMKSFSCLQKLD
jgi:hypothetical protein